MSSFSLQTYKQLFELSPIIFTGGIASNILGGALPILAISDALSFSTALVGGTIFSSDSAFAHFKPLARGSLVAQSIAKYPFANQSVAANAMIRNPITISLQMSTPNQNPSTFMAVMTALKNSFDQHNNMGGTYTVMTPAYPYTNCCMLELTDASTSDSLFPQNTWIIDFEKPLVTLQDAAGAQNSMMSQITNGVASSGATSGISSSQPTNSANPSANGIFIGPGITAPLNSTPGGIGHQ